MLEKSELYRLPWSMNDNPIAWLEITDTCNLACEGCYRKHLAGHKPIEQIREEVRFFQKWRNPDNVSIAGGEPLLHPQIIDIVAFIAESGLKPILLTNGVHLTDDVLRELRRAGLTGFTIHVDSRQGRPDWRDADEAALNDLRQQMTDRITAVGGMLVVFNSTVYPETAAQIPHVVRWARANIGRVHGLVFITYRGASTLDTIARHDGHDVNLAALGYAREHVPEDLVTAPQVYEWIKQAAPEYEPAAYLGGTIAHTSYKWLIAAQVGRAGRMYGSLGKRGMEIAQAGHHLLAGTYLAYPRDARLGARVFILSLWDRSLRGAARAWLGDVVRHPRRAFDPVVVQSIGIIQAPDLVADGRADMCDSCPDMTVWNDTLVNSCRMDEYRMFGGMVTMTERAEPVCTAEPAPELVECP